MEQPIDIDPIVTKYLREESLSPEEMAALQSWISQGKGRSEMLESLKNEPNSTKANLAHMEQIPHANIWDKVVNRVQQDGYWLDEDQPADIPLLADHSSKKFGWFRYFVAASLLLIISGGGWWVLTRKGNSTPPIAITPTPHSAEPQPGRNRATLTLADGRRVDLDSSANGLLASQGNVQVNKLADGQLAYQTSGTGSSDRALYNLLTTPRAGQFALALPDGSHVWLNNASSLRYPVAFAGAKREVELTGEAYFEVAKDASQPFIVHTSGGPAGSGTIEVLGTSFNIMAYSDETTERATLVDGSIRYAHGANSALLKPEEQSVVDANGSLRTVHHVNVAEITAWKNGYFHFDHTNLESTMRQLARWYDVSVSYSGNIPPQEFVGKIQRSMPLSSVLKGLEGEHVHFELQGRNLVVKP